MGVAAIAAAMLLAAWASARAAGPIDYEPAKECFARAAAAELERGILPGFSIAWVVDGEIVHAAGFGQADWQRGVPATTETIYRAGSISKMFSAVGAVQLAEKGLLDLDAPIQQALPDFSIEVPFERAAPITIRQLLCHRSGMIREAPLGGYLDSGQPTVEATLQSVAACALVNPPNTKTRYSNVGPTIVGRAVEVQSGLSFAEYQGRNVLGPLGMTSSAWAMNASLRPRLAKGRMRIARGDGGYDFEVAPEFELGTIPAGNLYTTARDLARFAAFLMSGEESGELVPPLVNPASLEMMYTPQLIDESTGFGLGFYVGEHGGHKTVRHNGAVYGFSSSLVVLPAERIGVVVLSNCDIASGRVMPLVDLALDLLLKTVRSETMPEAPKTIELPSEELARFAGEYESTSFWARLEVDGNELVGELSGQPIRLTPTAPRKLLANGRIMYRSPFEFERNEDGSVNVFIAAGQRFDRVDKSKTPRAPEAWNAWVGKYGPPFIPLVISIRHGHLYATVENEYDYRLTPLNRVTFMLPPGMYADEQIVFQTDDGGKVLGAVMANQYLPRRAQ
ncbi:MAG: serine hydrolase domain-containing protein [Pirellulales bacterium]